MSLELAAPGQILMKTWRSLTPWPGGRFLFSRFLGTLVPYTGTIHPLVLELSPGQATVELRDRRDVRNHLRSIHAIALINLGEVTSGLALLTSLPDGARGIVTHLSIEYLKKARGTIVATSRCEHRPLEPEIETERQVLADLKNAQGELVARTTATWRIRPASPR